MAASSQVADPEVSRRKFNREVATFRRLAATYRNRGWFLAEATFPEVIVVMAGRNIKPPALITGVRFDYTDYDFRPPSVRLVDPFSGEPYAFKDLPTRLPRSTGLANLRVEGLPAGLELPKIMGQQPLMQAYGDGDVPFLCLAGVREYHDHPGHSGDAWELHRGSGAGRLVRLLEVIDKYGTSPIGGYNLQLEARIIGYTQQSVPE